MNGWSDCTDEMGHVTDPSDEDLERLLSGMAPAGDGLDDLATVVRDVRTAFMVVPNQALEDRVAVARLTIDKGDPAVRPASNAHGPARQVSGLPKWRRRRPVLASLFASLGMKITTGVAVAATAATGGLAATGNLPDAAQSAVANVVEKIGVHIPDPADEKRQDSDHRQDGEVGEDAGKPEDAGQPEDAGKSVSDDVRDAVNGEYESGRDKGEAVSDAASQNRQDGGVVQGKPETLPIPESAPVAPTVPGGNPTDYGQDSQPTGNPTEYGPGTQPTGNPTEYGPGTEPGGNPTGFGGGRP